MITFSYQKKVIKRRESLKEESDLEAEEEDEDVYQFQNEIDVTTKRVHLESINLTKFQTQKILHFECRIEEYVLKMSMDIQQYILKNQYNKEKEQGDSNDATCLIQNNTILITFLQSFEFEFAYENQTKKLYDNNEFKLIRMKHVPFNFSKGDNNNYGFQVKGHQSSIECSNSVGFVISNKIILEVADEIRVDASFKCIKLSKSELKKRSKTF